MSDTEHPFPQRVVAALRARTPVRHRDARLRPASVLLPLFAAAADQPPLVWLLRRADALRTHGGQIALPGGQPDPGDADLLATALRETEEEIALAPALVQVLGVLDDHVTVTGYVITPYVGWITAPFAPTPRATEVSRVFAVALTVFDATPEPMTVAWGAAKRIVLSYRAGGEVVWGATAAILRGFATIVAGASAEGEASS